MIQGKYLYDKDDLSQIQSIRRQVFCIEQGADESYVADELDKNSIHVLVFDKDDIMATGRLFIQQDYFKLGRIAVLKQYRGMKFGDFVVRMLLDKAFSMGAKEVHIGSQLNAIPFYKKIGFEEVGEPYMDGTIMHYPMIIRKHNLCTGCGKKHS